MKPFKPPSIAGRPFSRELVSKEKRLAIKLRFENLGTRSLGQVIDDGAATPVISTEVPRFPSIDPYPA